MDSIGVCGKENSTGWLEIFLLSSKKDGVTASKMEQVGWRKVRYSFERPLGHLSGYMSLEFRRSG